MKVNMNTVGTKNTIFINSISKETLQKLSRNLFRNEKDYASPFLEHLEMISSRCKQENIVFPENIQNILSSLKEQAIKFAIEKNSEIEKGNVLIDKELYNAKFCKLNEENIIILQKFFSQFPVTQSVVKYFEAFKKNKSSMLFNPKISKISGELNIKDRVYYNGKQQVNTVGKVIDIRTSSCLGAGLYGTPHRDVAGSYAGIKGIISRFKICSDKIAIVNQEQMIKVIEEIVGFLEINDKKPSRKLVDSIIRKLFQFNGYDVAYTKEEISNLGGNIIKFYNRLAHGKNEEIVIYSQDAIEELKTNKRTKILDKFYQIYGIARKNILALIYS